MKKIIITFLLFSGALVVNAQDLKEIKTFFLLKQYGKAKESVDKFLANESNAKKAEGWYWKAQVYNQLAREEATPIPTGRTMFAESFNALKKYRELDPKAPLSNDEENVTLYNLYYGYYDFGVKTYNAKNFEESFGSFNDALQVHDYIYSSNIPGPKTIKFAVLDTDIVWNLVIIGNELKKGVEMVPFFKKLVDANVNEAKYLQAYQSIVLHYRDTKDQANFDKYLELGKKNYPKEVFWEAVDIENSTQGLTGEALFKKYDELTVKYPNSYVLFFNNAVELTKYINGIEDKGSPEYNKYNAQAVERIKKAIALDPTADANMMMASYYYNYSFDLSEMAGKVKGTKPDDVKKKAEFNKNAKQAMDDCIPYAEKAVELFSKLPKLKPMEKSNFKQAYDMLSEIYRARGDAKKSAEYKAKKDTVQ